MGPQANQPRLKVEYMPTASLVPYAHNSKEHPEEQVHQIAASIEQFGDCDPVGIWHDADGRPVIVEGHGRVLALKELGIESCPCISLDHLTDEQRRAYSHIHNQTTLTSGLDPDLLAADMGDLPDFDWQSFGFGDDREPIDCDHVGDVSSPGATIRWDSHEVTLADDEISGLNEFFDGYLDENGVSIGMFRRLLDGSD